MTYLRKAAEMALGAMERRNSVNDEYKVYLQEAIETLRQAIAQPEQEPYCWVQSKLSQGMFYKEKPRRIHTIPLFTAPPSKEWVSLTDEEIAYAVGSPIDEVYLSDFRKVEAALRSKNNG